MIRFTGLAGSRRTLAKAVLAQAPVQCGHGDVGRFCRSDRPRSADRPLSTNAGRAASIMAMCLRLILVTALSLAALVCPVLCADAPTSHDSSHGPCSTGDSDESSGHDRACDNSCFCSSATTQQNSLRSLLETGFTLAAFIDAVACQSSSPPEAAPFLLAKVLQPASGVERALPLLI